MSTTRADPPVTCRCADEDLCRLLTLMADGVDQWTASRLVWSPEEPLAAPATTAAPSTWSRWIALEVRRLGNRARARLGLRLAPDAPWRKRRWGHA